MPRPASSADTIVPGSVAEEHVIDETVTSTRTTRRSTCRTTRFEAWVAFGFFWLLALNIFYQFFTRYALNDSAAWTEEIARYLLICTVFIGMAAAVRMNRHIHVDFFYRLLPPAVGRVLSTLVDVVRSRSSRTPRCSTWQMMQKMAQLQDDDHRPADEPRLRRVLPSASPFAAVRSVQVGVENWRAGFSAARAARRPRSRRRCDARSAPFQRFRIAAKATRMTPALLVSFLALMVAGVPVAIAMAGSALVYILAHRRPAAVRGRAPHGQRHRQLPAARRAVLHHGRQPDEQRRHHQPHLQLRAGAGRLDEGRPRPRQHHRLGDLRRHVGHGHRRRRRARHHRDQGDERPRLRHGFLGRASPPRRRRSARSFRRRCRS